MWNAARDVNDLRKADLFIKKNKDFLKKISFDTYLKFYDIASYKYMYGKLLSTTLH